MSNDAIVLQDVVKIFSVKKEKITALSGISAQIKYGTITGIIGPDGAGKTTLMRLIAGLLTPTQGYLQVDGSNPQQSKNLHTLLGYMPQKFGLYQDLTVLENLTLYADLHNILGKNREALFAKLLHFTDLKRFTSRLAGKLSGGMKQKLGLACVLIGHPRILLLDEPSVGVDPISRRELWAMVNELTTEGITILWSTSYLDEAERCQEVLVLNEGKLIFAGPPNALTKDMEGRSVQIQQIEGNHRTVLKNALRSNKVIDGVIQGENVRLVLREKNEAPDLASLNAGSQAKLVAVTPRFEDAFIAMLGGGPGGDSILAKVMRSLPINPSESVIVAIGLTKQFGDFTAVDHINFSVKQGEIFGLLGPNGAGKSTTFKMMCGLLIPTAGDTTLFGHNLQKSGRKARQLIGYMAQKFSLYDDLPVEQNLRFFSGIYGLTGEEQAKKIQEMIDAFDLKPFVDLPTKELSLGFKQRLALACAIMHEPSVLFLDEPTSGVDPITRREFWTHINGLVEKGVTVIVTTHYMDEAEYCDRIGLVYRSKMIALGTPQYLKHLANKEAKNLTMEDAFIELILDHNKLNTEQEIVKDVADDTIKNQKNITIHNPSIRRTLALSRKEFFQIIRDPSNYFLSFFLPILMIFIYGFGLNLDTSVIKLGMLMENTSPEARHFEQAFVNSPVIQLIPLKNRMEAARKITNGQIQGFVSIQPDFASNTKNTFNKVSAQLVTDGSDPNTAGFIADYVAGITSLWLQFNNQNIHSSEASNITIQPRYWFNTSTISRFYILPGSIAILMTIIGALLTSAVIAREWELGTMEALFTTPITPLEFLTSKFFPYYVVGIISMTVCTLITIIIFKVPFRGSFFLLWIETSAFLCSALGIGLLFSTITRNQFNASQIAINISYLPAVMLSGFFFDIYSMPLIIQLSTYLVPARYFVNSLQTLFLAGNVMSLIIRDFLFLIASAIFFLGMTYKATHHRLD